MADRNRFVNDGCCRAQSAAEPKIREQVNAEFAEQLKSANGWERFWLKRAIDREVNRRLEKVAPSHALY
jgi:hypothetical protein